MPNLPRTLDLSTVRERLVKGGSLRRLADTIGTALNAQSCLLDLRQSAANLEALQDIGINNFLGNQVAPSEQSREVVETALLEGAVSLYVRATHSGSKKGSRGSIQIVDHLSESERKDHETMVDVRNRAVAHVYQNKLVSDINRHRGAVLLVEHEGGWRPGAAASRVTFDRHLLGCLTRQLPVATRIIDSKFDGLLHQLAELIDREGSHPDFLTAIKGSEFSLPEFFGSEERAMKAVAAGLNPGSMTCRD
jgi:hypothetical protein